MSFSISDLGNLQASEPVDMSAVAPKGRSFPQRGVYTLRVPDLDPDFTFGATAANYLSATIDPEIVDGPHAGYTVRFQKFSAKTFNETDRDTGETRKTSQIGRLIAGCGDYRPLSGEPAEIAAAVLDQSGKTFRALLDWRAYNKRTGEAVEGMDNFPKDASGNPLPWVVDEGDLDDSGKPRRYRANLQIVKIYPGRATSK